MRDRHPAVGRLRHSFRTAFIASAAVLLLGTSARAQVPAATASPTFAHSDSYADNQEPAAQETPAPTAASVLSNTRIRFFADVGFGRPLQEKLPSGGLQNSKYSFQIADLHLYVTSKLSEDWSFLSEVLFTSDFSNEAEAELDRLLVQYSPNKYLRAGFGKFNSAIGYYPNQFHRAKFFQTATGRPLMFSDEDNGGILPVHQVGVTAQGEIPSGSLGLHYIGEIANGRAFSMNSAEIQNFADRDNMKAVNAGLFVQPDALPALDAGFSFYHDTIQSDTLAKFRETITAVHAVWVTPDLEFLNEAIILKHEPEGSGATTTTKSAYTQLSRRFGVMRPYVRYEYQDVPVTDPVFGLGDVIPPFGVRKAISAGLNFGLGVFAVVKVQYDHAEQYDVWANGVHAQLAVTF